MKISINQHFSHLGRSQTIHLADRSYCLYAFSLATRGQLQPIAKETVVTLKGNNIDTLQPVGIV